MTNVDSSKTSAHFYHNFTESHAKIQYSSQSLLSKPKNLTTTIH